MNNIPRDLRLYLESHENELFLYEGALQFRSPKLKEGWNSLKYYWIGEGAFYKKYQSLTENDIIFAQDYFGDQFFLRNGTVHQLLAEIDEVETFELPFIEWINWVALDPEENLNVSLTQGVTQGNLLMAVPPFCFKGGEECDIIEREAEVVIEFHANLANQVREAQHGEKIKVQIPQ